MTDKRLPDLTSGSAVAASDLFLSRQGSDTIDKKVLASQLKTFFSTSPTLVTPDLGTPTAGVLTSATGLPVSTGIAGLGTGIATFLATPTSANLATAVTNETGSGPLVFANSAILRKTYTAQTTTYAILTTDEIVNCTSGTFTVTLPTAVGVSGQCYTIINSGTGAITIATTSSQTINGITTKILNSQYLAINVMSDGANWIII